MQTVWQDLRYALRMLGKNPRFSATVVFTLALGIGATTAIFSVVYGVLLRPLPYRHPEQIVRVWEQNDEGVQTSLSDPNFDDLRTQNHSFTGMAEYTSFLQNVMVGAEASRVQTAYVSDDFLNVMGVQPVLGRTFHASEQHPGAGLAVLLSYSYWKRALSASENLASLHIEVGGKPASVIGVLPPGFRFPDNADIWLPRETLGENPSRNAHNWRGIGRFGDGATLKQARSELSAIAQRLKKQFGPDTTMVSVAVEPLREAMTSNVRSGLFVLLGASAFLLLIACANVVNLMLAHSAAREKELSIRAALGAQRKRLVWQFLTEAFVFSVLGGFFGVLVAYWGVNALLALAPNNLPRIDNVRINVPVLLFSLATVVLLSFALGVVTAWRAASSHYHTPVTVGARGAVGSSTKQRLGRLIAAGQIGVALLLLIGAGLLGKSLLRVLSVNSGFRTQGIATMEVSFPESFQKADRIAFLDKLIAELRQVPGVQEVGGTNQLPLSGSGFADGWYLPMNPRQLTPRMQQLIERSASADFRKDPSLLGELTRFFDDIFRDRSSLGEADFVVASDGFFKALGISLLQGRLFDEHDTIDAPHVALISESLANEKWPNENPLGRTIEFGNMDGDLRLLTIVGVVGDVRDHSLEAGPRPTVYVDYRQRPQGAWMFSVVMQTSGKPEAVFPAARAILHDLDPNIPPQFRSFSEVYASSFETRRFTLVLVSVFSAVALLLAMTGIYGVISYSVAQRTREIGVRMALGASTREVLGMVLKQGAITGSVGILVGVLGSLALTRWLQSQLFEVSPTDPTTFLELAFLLLLISLAACWIPGQRAARVDPMVALRYE